MAEVTGSRLLVAARGTPASGQALPAPRRAVPPNAEDRRLAVR